VKERQGSGIKSKSSGKKEGNMRTAFLVLILFVVAGCYKTVYVPHGQAVQLREA
jgi:hypothetical protein